MKKRKNNKNKNQKNNNKKWLFLTIFFIICDLLAATCFFIMYGPFDYVRNLYVTTAMKTMNHQYLAEWFYDANTISEILNRTEGCKSVIEFGSNIGCECQWKSLPRDILIVYHHDTELVYHFHTFDIQLVYHSWHWKSLPLDSERVYHFVSYKGEHLRWHSPL